MKCQGEILVRPCVWVEQERSELPDTPILHSKRNRVICTFLNSPVLIDLAFTSPVLWRRYSRLSDKAFYKIFIEYKDYAT